MDSSVKEIKRFYFKEISPFNPDSLPTFITVSGIHRAVLDNDTQLVKYFAETKKSVNIKEEQYNFTPLHLAVIKNSVEILDYLLSRHDIEVDTKCIEGDTPLKLACSFGAYNIVKKLIEAGANVNLPNDEDVSPLHISVSHPDICHILIQNGANIDATDSNGHTALHRAVQSDSTEVVHMLLYYNADTTILTVERDTAFTLALIHRNIEAQEALFEYVVNFSPARDPPYYSRTILGLASIFQSPFYDEIILRALEVEYGEDFAVWEDGCPLMLCITHISDEKVFGRVWNRLVYDEIDTPIDMCKLFDIRDKKYFTNVLQVIIESGDNFEVVVDSFTRSENSFSQFILQFMQSGFDGEQLVVLTYRLLEYGYRPTLDDIYNLYLVYEASELQRVLLYMDIDYKELFYSDSYIYLHPMFVFDFNVRVLADEIESGKCILRFREMLVLLEYFQDPRLVNALQLQWEDEEDMSDILSGLPRVPSLLELARYQARKYICERFKVTNICQFHTLMDYSGIAPFYKDILTYRRRIYSVKT